MKRFTIVELCLVSHPKAEKIKEANKELGLQVYRYRGAYITILGDEYSWRALDAVPAEEAGSIFVFNEDGEPIRIY